MALVDPSASRLSDAEAAEASERLRQDRKRMARNVIYIFYFIMLFVAAAYFARAAGGSFAAAFVFSIFLVFLSAYVFLYICYAVYVK